MIGLRGRSWWDWVAENGGNWAWFELLPLTQHTCPSSSITDKVLAAKQQRVCMAVQLFGDGPTTVQAGSTAAQRWWSVGCPRKCRDWGDEGWVGRRTASAASKIRRRGLKGVAGAQRGGADGQARWAVVSTSAAGVGAIWVVRSGRVASGPASKAMEKRAQEQERGRNGRRACRLLADVYATMHPQCTKGPRPGVVPGTRAFDGGGVEVICSSRHGLGEARSGWRRDLSRAGCTALRQQDVFAAGRFRNNFTTPSGLRLASHKKCVDRRVPFAGR